MEEQELAWGSEDDRVKCRLSLLAMAAKASTPCLPACRSRHTLIADLSESPHEQGSIPTDSGCRAAVAATAVATVADLFNCGCLITIIRSNDSLLIYCSRATAANGSQSIRGS